MLELIIKMLRIMADKKHSGVIILKIAYQDGGIRNFQAVEEKKIEVTAL